MITLMQSLKDVMKVSGFITRAFLLISLALITCTCSGLKLTLAQPITESQIGFSLYSGKLVKPINVVMECAISKTDALVFHSWHQGKLLTWPQYHLIHGSAYCPSLGLTLKKCSPIRLYQYPLITRSFSNQSKTVWTGQRRSSPIEYQRRSLPEENLTKVRRQRKSTVLTPQSTGRTQGTTRMTVKSLNSSYTTNQANGRGRTTSSTTGASRRRH